jgi:PiT family inorganic phosphate transporter
MLGALFLSALVWNVGTWVLGIPNSSGHALIGSLVGISISAALKRSCSLHDGVEWGQILTVLEALLISPVLGFVGAMVLFRLIKAMFKDDNLYKPPEGDKPPVWWMRGVLILTCTGVSFAHGTNDGQMSIGLIMLTIIGLSPLGFAINQSLEPAKALQLRPELQQAGVMIAQYGDDKKGPAVAAAADAARRLQGIADLKAIPKEQRATLRADANRVLAELKGIAQGKGDATPKPEQKRAKDLQKKLTDLVNYAPWWVRILSAGCLGLGTMIGYKRIVTTLGERLGNEDMAPAQGASAELVAAAVIGVAGFTGGPVSTTHVVTSGIAGTMVSSGAGVQMKTIWQIALA